MIEPLHNETTGEAIVRLLDRDDEIERSLRRVRRSCKGGDRTAAAMSFRAEWLRFEVETYELCQRRKPGLWLTLASLFIAGKRTGETRNEITRIINNDLKG